MKYRIRGAIRYLSQDFSYKTVALAVALVLWITMLGRKDITFSRKLPIQFLSESLYEVAGQRQKEVEVEVAGPRMALKKFGQTDQMYTLDLTGLKSGTHKIRLTREGFAVPVGVKVVSIKPEEINVTLVPIAKREE